MSVGSGGRNTDIGSKNDSSKKICWSACRMSGCCDEQEGDFSRYRRRSQLRQDSEPAQISLRRRQAPPCPAEETAGQDPGPGCLDVFMEVGPPSDSWPQNIGGYLSSTLCRTFPRRRAGTKSSHGWRRTPRPDAMRSSTMRMMASTNCPCFNRLPKRESRRRL